MNPRYHGLLSIILSISILLTVPPPNHPSVFIIFVVVVGVGIDLDHFILGRINTGSWKNLQRAIRNPVQMILKPKAIFDFEDIWREQRLFSHMLLGGGAVSVLLWFSPYWAGVTAVTVYFHIIADIYADLRKRLEYIKKASRELEEM